jgi:hypothetical protein
VVADPINVTLLGEGEESLEFNSETAEYEPKIVGVGEAWEQLRGPGGELTSVPMEYECGKVVVLKTEGSMAGVLTPVDVSGKKFGLAFAEGNGAQGLTQEANILGKGFKPIGKFVLTNTQKVKQAGKVEIRE